VTTAEALAVLRRACDDLPWSDGEYEALALIERRLEALKEADDLLGECMYWGSTGRDWAARVQEWRERSGVAEPQDDCPSLVRGDWEGL
jgi:hypothetical protein